MKLESQMDKKNILLSFDVDWAPEYMLEDLLILLNDTISACTIFATHYSPLLIKYTKQYEIGLHPNFNFLLEGKQNSNYRTIIDDLIAMYPHTVGYRSHSLTNNTNIQQYFKEKSFIYESNQLSHSHNQHYYDELEDMSHIFINFSDGLFIKHFSNDLNAFSANLYQRIETTSNTTFMFHPVHIFLNSTGYDNYNKIKTNLNDYKTVKQHINNYEHNGVRKLFIQLLQYIQTHKIETKSHKDFAKKLKDLNI